MRFRVYALMCCAVLCCAVLCCAVLCCTGQSRSREVGSAQLLFQQGIRNGRLCNYCHYIRQFKYIFMFEMFVCVCECVVMHGDDTLCNSLTGVTDGVVFSV
ncbi:MAG TPA: hypothetical protein V6C97_34050 [Oculatellaceae cyanobacterium]